jgi:hypothetical protein
MRANFRATGLQDLGGWRTIGKPDEETMHPDVHRLQMMVSTALVLTPLINLTHLR